MRSQRSIRCSWNRVGREPSFTVWSRKSFCLTATGERTACELTAQTVMLEPNTAQTIAISLHELATNAAKYGSLSAADGDVEIAWSRTADGRLSLRWTESGGPTVTPPTHRGFGTRIMENIIGGQLGGKVRFDWRDQGLTCEIALPLCIGLPPVRRDGSVMLRRLRLRTSTASLTNPGNNLLRCKSSLVAHSVNSNSYLEWSLSEA